MLLLRQLRSRPREAEVDEAQLALRREEQVVRLEVAVDQLVGVQAVHRLQRLRVRVRVRVRDRG